MSKNSEARFVYVTPTSKKRGKTTVAYRFNDAAGVIEYNSGRCNLKDQFTKSTGRAVAAGRLAGSVTHPNMTIPYGMVAAEDGKPRYSLITQEILSRFSEE